MSDLYLARHGQTAYNAEGRFQGWSPVPLDATGRAQALELATAVAAVAPTTLVCSDIARARETADDRRRAGSASSRSSTRASPRPRPATGPTAPSRRSTPRTRPGFERFLALDADWGFPGGETFAQQAARVQDGPRGLARARGTRTRSSIVCHGNVIRLALRAAGREVPDRPENGSLVAL